MKQQPPTWAKTPPPAGTPIAACRWHYRDGNECGAAYLDYDHGHDAHQHVFGHRPANQSRKRQEDAE